MPEQSKFENVDVTASLEAIMKQNGITLLFKSWLYSTFLLVRGTLHTINVNRGDCVACVISKCA